MSLFRSHPGAAGDKFWLRSCGCFHFIFLQSFLLTLEELSELRTMTVIAGIEPKMWFKTFTWITTFD